MAAGAQAAGGELDAELAATDARVPLRALRGLLGPQTAEAERGGRVTALSRRKGAAFEREVAERLRTLWPDARRGLGQARTGAEAPDVDGSPWWIQTKHGARPNIPAAMRQAAHDAAGAHDDRPPVAITRITRGPVLVTMRLEDWLDVVAVWESQRPDVEPTA